MWESEIEIHHDAKKTYTNYYVSYNDRYSFVFKDLKLVDAWVYRTEDEHYTTAQELKSLFVDPEGYYHRAYGVALLALKKYISNPKAFKSDSRWLDEQDRKLKVIENSIQTRRSNSYSNPVLTAKADRWNWDKENLAKSPYIIEFTAKENDGRERFANFWKATSLVNARKEAMSGFTIWGKSVPRAKIYKTTANGRVLEGECVHGSLYGHADVYYWKTKEGNFSLSKDGRIGAKLTKENIGKR